MSKCYLLPYRDIGLVSCVAIGLCPVDIHICSTSIRNLLRMPSDYYMRLNWNIVEITDNMHYERGDGCLRRWLLFVYGELQIVSTTGKLALLSWVQRG